MSNTCIIYAADQDDLHKRHSLCVHFGVDEDGYDRLIEYIRNDSYYRGCVSDDLKERIICAANLVLCDQFSNIDYIDIDTWDKEVGRNVVAFLITEDYNKLPDYYYDPVEISYMMVHNNVTIYNSDQVTMFGRIVGRARRG